MGAYLYSGIRRRFSFGFRMFARVSHDLVALGFRNKWRVRPRVSVLDFGAEMSDRLNKHIPPRPDKWAS
jgi:hypothetical protein